MTEPLKIEDKYLIEVLMRQVGELTNKLIQLEAALSQLTAPTTAEAAENPDN